MKIYATLLAGALFAQYAQSAQPAIAPQPSASIALGRAVIVEIDYKSHALKKYLNLPQKNPSSIAMEKAFVAMGADRTTKLWAALGRPEAINFMVASGDRLSDADRSRLELRNDPRAKLEQYIRVIYKDVNQASIAKGLLQSERLVVSVSDEFVNKMSWYVNDPYFTSSSFGGSGIVNPKRQWGLHAMNFPAAWDRVRGNSYIAILDGGMPGNIVASTAPGPQTIMDFVVHEDLVKNYRRQFSRTPFINEIATSPPLEQNKHWHATHVAGIIAAQADNGIGIVGACPSCSISAYPFTNDVYGLYGNQNYHTPHLDNYIQIDAFVRAVDSGNQIVNWSGEIMGGRSLSCIQGASNNPPVCSTLDLLKSRDILVIQSTGNFSETNQPFPSNLPIADTTVLAVGGTSSGLPRKSFGTLEKGALWTTNFTEVIYDPAANVYNNIRVGSAWAGMDGVVAPAEAIVSTVPKYPNSEGEYLASAPYNCGDYNSDLSAVGDPTRRGDGYASCTGTSMAAPHVTALAGLIRSINPLISAAKVREIIQKSGNGALNRTPELGYGLPDASKAVNAAILTNPAKLTPLFSLYSAERFDSFYTSVPQMAVAALEGTLEPRAHCPLRSRTAGCTLDNEKKKYLSSYGSVINQWGDNYSAYAAFPGADNNATTMPRAEMWVFTTHENPKDYSIPLIPLYRLSWKCGDASPQTPAICNSTVHHVDTAYATTEEGLAAFQTLGYQTDGIEGYIYPKNMPQPTGTERLMRKYNPSRDDHAIFPESKATYMSTQGYVQNTGSDWLGYVYPNFGSVPVIR